MADTSNSAYLEALPRYMTEFDAIFSRARERSEFEFLLSLFRVRGLSDGGWDPYETTLSAIPVITKVIRKAEFEAARHLQLWGYGHILEASEPYEILANLIDVGTGGRFKHLHFPPKKHRPQTPGEKISQLESMAVKAGLPNAITPLRETWNRDLRNAIFHADYTLHGGEVRTIRPYRIYTHEELMILMNKALAYHEALASIHKVFIGSYTEPEVISVHPSFSRDPDERAVVIVRKGHGAIGMKDAWTEAQIKQEGRIPFLLGRFTAVESKILDADHSLALLPSLSEQTSSKEKILRFIHRYLYRFSSLRNVLHRVGL